MPERRRIAREDALDRRQLPRPSLALNLLILSIAVAFAAGAKLHRLALNNRFEKIMTETVSTPTEVMKIKSELSQMELSQDQLKRQLEARMKQIQSLKGQWFYLSIDTNRRKAYFNYGDHVLREANVAVGPPATVESDRRTYTFAPLKGASHVVDKAYGMSWRAPAWVYRWSRQPVPGALPRIENGLGKFVLFLPNNYVIHSPPPPDSPLKGAKPGSFMLPEDFIAAIWPRIEEGMPVYVY